MYVELWSFPAFGGLKPITHANSRPPHSLKRFTSDHWVNRFVMTRVHIFPKPCPLPDTSYHQNRSRQKLVGTEVHDSFSS